jgi:hypothetical protein
MEAESIPTLTRGAIGPLFIPGGSVIDLLARSLSRPARPRRRVRQRGLLKSVVRREPGRDRYPRREFRRRDAAWASWYLTTRQPNEAGGALGVSRSCRRRQLHRRQSRRASASSIAAGSVNRNPMCAMPPVCPPQASERSKTTTSRASGVCGACYPQRSTHSTSGTRPEWNRVMCPLSASNTIRSVESCGEGDRTVRYCPLWRYLCGVTVTRPAYA